MVCFISYVPAWAVAWNYLGQMIGNYLGQTTDINDLTQLINPLRTTVFFKIVLFA